MIFNIHLLFWDIVIKLAYDGLQRVKADKTLVYFLALELSSQVNEMTSVAGKNNYWL